MEEREQAGSTASRQAEDKGRVHNEEFCPFPNENLFTGRGSSHMTRFAFCQGYSVYGTRTGDREEWKWGDQ